MVRKAGLRFASIKLSTPARHQPDFVSVSAVQQRKQRENEAEPPRERKFGEPLDRRNIQGEFNRIDPKTLRPSALGVLFTISRYVLIPASFLAVSLMFLVAVTGKPTFIKQAADRMVLNVTGAPKVPTLSGFRVAAQLRELNAQEEQILTDAVRDPSEVSKQQSQIKFISGLIAMHRPSIGDVGVVAKDIVELSASEGVDPFFIAAIISVESNFGTQAVSRAGARGLMQLMPSTAKHVHAEETGSKGQPAIMEPRTNIKLGISYIKSLERRYSGNRLHALAAYNWGPDHVDKALKRQGSIPRGVRRYAHTVLDRTKQWSRHYQKAKESAQKIALVG